MDAQWQPQRRGYTSKADDKGVHVYTSVDGLEAVEGIVNGVVDDNARDVAHGGRHVGETGFEFLVTVEQLREPDHEGVVTVMKFSY